MDGINSIVHQGLLGYFITYLVIGIPIFVGTIIVVGRRRFFSALGLSGNMLRGVLVALLFVSPMLIGSATIGTVTTDTSYPVLAKLITGTIFAGFFEELYFRAFLFGLIFRNTKLGFIPAIILGAVIFAIGHLYQSDDNTVKLGIFMVTFLGSAWFAWLYTEWNYNIWVPIFLHTLMNASWMIFDISDTAAGNTYANIFRTATIALSIAFTVIYKLRKSKTLEVNRATVLLK